MHDDRQDVLRQKLRKLAGATIAEIKRWRPDLKNEADTEILQILNREERLGQMTKHPNRPRDIDGQRVKTQKAKN